MVVMVLIDEILIGLLSSLVFVINGVVTGVFFVFVVVVVVVLVTLFVLVMLVMQLFILAGTDFGLVIFVTDDNGTDGSITVVTRKRDVDKDAGKIVGEQLFDGGGVMGDVLVSTTRDT